MRELEFYKGKEKAAGGGGDKAALNTGPLSEGEIEFCKEKVDSFLESPLELNQQGSEEHGSYQTCSLPMSDPREIWGFFCQLHKYVGDLRASKDRPCVPVTAPAKIGGEDGGGGKLQAELDSQAAQISYLNGMLGQKTKKRHPLRYTQAEREDGEDKKDKRGSGGGRRAASTRMGHHGHTIDCADPKSVASVYAARSGSPRHALGGPGVPYALSNGGRSPLRQRRRRSPSSTGGGRGVGGRTTGGGRDQNHKAKAKSWALPFSSQEAEEVWKESSQSKAGGSKNGASVKLGPGSVKATPPLSKKSSKGENPRLLPYLGRDSYAGQYNMLPERRVSGSDKAESVEPILSNRKGGPTLNNQLNANSSMEEVDEAIGLAAAIN